MVRDNNPDTFFKRFQNRIDDATKALLQAVQTDTSNELQQTVGREDKVTVQKKNDDEVIVKEETDRNKPIDLKPFFRQSPSARATKKGGWYLIVPIRRYAYRNAESARSASGMSKRMYTELRTAPLPQERTLVSDYLYENRKTSPIPELNYEPKSNNITRLKNPQRKNSSIYISFRTVSNTSAPNSWILNRDKATEDNLTPDIERIIEQVKQRHTNG